MKAEKRLSNAEISAFCESVAMMLAAGIQTDEAVHMLGESQGAGFGAQAGAGGANALRADSSREASAENRSATTPLGRVCEKLVCSSPARICAACCTAVLMVSAGSPCLARSAFTSETTCAA